MERIGTKTDKRHTANSRVTTMKMRRMRSILVELTMSRRDNIVKMPCMSDAGLLPNYHIQLSEMKCEQCLSD